MLEILIHLNFFMDFNYFKEDLFCFRSPSDCELNNLRIVFSQKNFFFFKMRIIIAFAKMHSSLAHFDCFNYFFYLYFLINQINCHSNGSHQHHFLNFDIIGFQEDFCQLMVSHLYLPQEMVDYLFNFVNADYDASLDFVADSFL